MKESKSINIYLFALGLVLLLSLPILMLMYSHTENQEVTFKIFNMSFTINEWIYSLYATLAFIGGGTIVLATILESKRVESLVKRLLKKIGELIEKRDEPHFFWIGVLFVTLFHYMFYVIVQEPCAANDFMYTFVGIPISMSWKLYLTLQWSIPITGFVLMFEGLYGFKRIFRKEGHHELNS